MAKFSSIEKEDEHHYVIVPRPSALGGGWRLTLFRGCEEVGEKIFSVLEEDPQVGTEWWNSMTQQQRGYWLGMALSATPDYARHAYLLGEAYADAREDGQAWLREQSAPDSHHLDHGMRGRIDS